MVIPLAIQLKVIIIDKYLHGEAVAIGMAMMTKNEDFIKILLKFLLSSILATIDLTRQELLKYINNDKENKY